MYRYISLATLRDNPLLDRSNQKLTDMLEILKEKPHTTKLYLFRNYFTVIPPEIRWVSKIAVNIFYCYFIEMLEYVDMFLDIQLYLDLTRVFYGNNDYSIGIWFI